MLLREIVGTVRLQPDTDHLIARPWFADLVKQTMSFNEVYARWGAVQSVKFSHVDLNGGDVYVVRQEGGFSTWTIWLDSSGVIDADHFRG